MSKESKQFLSFDTKVDQENVDPFIKTLNSLEKNGSPLLEIKITSYGGSVSHGLALYDAIRLYPGHTRAIVIGTAASMAAVFLQAFDERWAATHAEITVHNISNTFSLDVLRNDTQQQQKIHELEVSQDLIYAILAKRTNLTLKAVKKLCKEDRAQNAEEALAIGLIDKIV